MSDMRPEDFTINQKKEEVKGVKKAKKEETKKNK